jgi:hypothetical protein
VKSGKIESNKPAEGAVVSLTPWLQPGVKRDLNTTNRFNGFSL